MTAIVGLDVGTTAVKAIAIAPDGTVLARAEAGYPLSMPRPGWAEQDPELWWEAAAHAQAQLGVADIAGIGLSGQMHGLVALDDTGRVIRPALLWNDQRTAAQCAAIEERVGRERLIALTGNGALTGFTAPKLLWLRDEEPEAYARIARIMLPKDLVRLRLTGEHATDVTDASGTLLFDVAQRTWSDAVLGALDIPAGILPPALESAAVSGHTADGVPVAAGAGDQAAGALGVGVVGAGSAVSVVLGTSGVVFGALPAFAADDQGRLQAACHAVPATWHLMGVMLSAAGSLQWLRDTVAPDVPFDVLVAEAAAWEPGAEGLLFQPYLAGERAPHPDPDARGAFTGLALRHDRGALVRAVLEGVAHGLREILDLLRDRGVHPEVGRVSGGGARSDLWLEILAAVLDLPLERTAVEEGAAYGAALLGGVAAGIFPDEQAAVAACVHPAGAVAPRADGVAAYAEQHERYTALYPSLRALR